MSGGIGSMDEGERELFAAAIRRATETSTGGALDSALADLGWRDALEAERSTAVAVLFESQGQANVTSSALDLLLAAALGDERVERVERPAVILPPLREREVPGRLEAGRCTLRGLASAALTKTDAALVAAATDSGTVVVTVDTSALDIRPVDGIDPALALVEVSGDFDVAARAVGSAAEVDWSQAAMWGQLALGHELVGAGRTMLELARLHALDRVQFGGPIASFQAVRHRLAESLVAIESAAGLLDATWDEPSIAGAAMAKALAGRSARTVARHAQQVLAGIGFTTEHPLHHYVRRTIVLDQLLGAGTVLTRQLGADVLESGTLPPVFAL